MRKFLISATAAALAIGVATPLAAAPLSNAAGLKAAAPSDTTQVHWRGRGNGWWPGAVVGGLAAGAIIGSQAYGGYPYQYGGAYAYDTPSYGGYAYAPGYYSYSRRGLDHDCIGDYDSAGYRC